MLFICELTHNIHNIKHLLRIHVRMIVQKKKTSLHEDTHTKRRPTLFALNICYDKKLYQHFHHQSIAPRCYRSPFEQTISFSYVVQ